MKKYRVEFGFGENFFSVAEWQTSDDLIIDAENAEEAAKYTACTDGLENALFRVCEMIPDEFGVLEKHGEYEYFEF